MKSDIHPKLQEIIDETFEWYYQQLSGRKDDGCEKTKRDPIILEGDAGIIGVGIDGLFVINKYGDVAKYRDGSVSLDCNSPAYDELYEYWLKTKDKLKRKRKSEQLPGQVSLFDTTE